MKRVKVPTITELVGNGSMAYFTVARDNELWYEVRYGVDPPFAFPIPYADTREGEFRAEDKALYFMRWIRKRVEYWNKVNEESANADA